MRSDDNRKGGGIAAVLCDPSIKIEAFRFAFPRTSDVVAPMRALWILASFFYFFPYFLISLTWMDTTCSIRTSTIQKYTAPKSISCLSNNTHTQVNVLRRRRFMQGKAVRGENVLNGEPLHSFLFSAVLPVCNEGSVLFVFFLLISKKENRSSGFTHQGSYLSFKIVKKRNHRHKLSAETDGIFKP